MINGKLFADHPLYNFNFKVKICTMNKLLLIFSVFVWASCANTKDLGPGDNGTNTDEYVEADFQETENQAEFKNLFDEDSLFASIKKGACFGTCPIYTLKIYNSGYTVLNGVRFIDLIGNHSTKLSKQQMLAFIEGAMNIGYMELEDNYDNIHVTDLPSATTSIVIDGVRKTVRRRAEYPRGILNFEKLFEDLLESEKWKYIDGGNER